MNATNDKIQQLKYLHQQIEEGQKKLHGLKTNLVNMDEAIKSGQIINSLDEIKMRHGRIGARYY